MESALISFPIFGDSYVLEIPSYVSIFGFKVYLYGLLITVGFVLATLYLYKRRNALELTRDNVLDMVIMAVPFGIIGARLYYAIFNPTYYFGPGNWLNIFKLREGGLAIYGGVIGGAVAYLIYSKVKKIPFGKLTDAACFGLFIGQSIGRWGNFFNREAFGVETNLPWRMGLTTFSGTVYVHPAFLYELLWNAAGFIILHFFSKKPRKYYGQFFLFYLAWYGLGRFFIEGIRSDSLYIYGTNIRVSQILAALTFLAAVAILIRNRVLDVRSPLKTEPDHGPIGEEAGSDPEDEELILEDGKSVPEEMELTAEDVEPLEEDVEDETM